MRRRIALNILFLSCIGLGNISFTNAPAHAFYVSITEIELEAEWGELKIKVKVFTNDLEDALEKAGYGKLFLDTEKEVQHAHVQIFQYLNSNISFKINQTPLALRFQQKMYRDDACWIYLRAGQVCQAKSLSVSNQILLELFDTQTNIIRLKADGERQIANLDKQIYSKEFRLE